MKEWLRPLNVYLNIFLGIIPCTTSVGGRDGNLKYWHGRNKCSDTLAGLLNLNKYNLKCM
jgi:hypothetical protein